MLLFILSPKLMATICANVLMDQVLYDGPNKITISMKENGTVDIKSDDGYSANFKFAPFDIKTVAMRRVDGAAERQKIFYDPATIKVNLSKIYQVIRAENYFLLATNIGLMRVRARDLSQLKHPRLHMFKEAWRSQYKILLLYWELKGTPQPPGVLYSRFWVDSYIPHIIPADKISLNAQGLIEVEFKNEKHPKTRIFSAAINNPFFIVAPFSAEQLSQSHTLNTLHHLAIDDPLLYTNIK